MESLGISSKFSSVSMLAGCLIVGSWMTERLAVRVAEQMLNKEFGELEEVSLETRREGE